MKLFQRLSTLLIVAAAGLIFTPLGLHALWDSDEGRYAEIAREMLQTHHWLVPHLNGVLYFEKPPFAYWLTALGLALFGPNAFGARFFSAFFGLLTVFLTFRIGRAWKNERTGLFAGLILTTSAGFFMVTQYLVVDLFLTFWLTLVLYAALGLLPTENASSLRRYSTCLALGLAGAFLTKGLIAFVIPGAVFILFMGWRRSFSPLKKIRLWPALFVFGIVALPWYGWMCARFPFFGPFFFIHEHFARYFTHVHQRAGAFYYFAPVLAIGFVPWIFYAPLMSWTWFRRRAAALKTDSTAAFLWLWIIFIFGFFSLSGSKLPAYILPLFPALALLTGDFFAQRVDAATPSPWLLRSLGALILFFFAVLAFLKWDPCPVLMQDPLVNVLREQSAPLLLTLAFCLLMLVSAWGVQRGIAVLSGTLLAQVLFLSALTSLAPFLDPWLSTEKIAHGITTRAAPDDPVVVYGVSYETYVQSLAFYTRRRLAVYGPAGELALGAAHDPAAALWFAEGAAADSALAHLPVGAWVVTDEEYEAHLRARGMRQAFTAVEKSGRLELLQKIQ